MKSLLVLSSLLLLSFNVFASKQGQDKGNGGDICENKMRTITNEIESWLLKDEFKGIKLPGDLSEDQYKDGMLDAIKKSVLSCTTDKLFIGSAEKTCKNFDDKNSDSHIICNFARFLATNENDKYKLIHHEFAGVAGFEKNLSEKSSYIISNQISDYLKIVPVLKLGIKRDSRCHNQGMINFCPGEKGVYNLGSSSYEGTIIGVNPVSRKVSLKTEVGSVFTDSIDKFTVRKGCVEGICANDKGVHNSGSSSYEGTIIGVNPVSRKVSLKTVVGSVFTDSIDKFTVRKGCVEGICANDKGVYNSGSSSYEGTIIGVNPVSREVSLKTEVGSVFTDSIDKFTVYSLCNQFNENSEERFTEGLIDFQFFFVELN